MPLIILHAFLGSGDNWLSIAKALSDRWHVWLPDLPNHGGSPWRDTMRYPDLAGSVRDWMDQHRIKRASIIGHSLGGKTAMQLTQLIPDCLHKIVVVDIAPIAYADRHLAILSALNALDLTASSRTEVDRALALRLSDSALRSFLLKNLVRQGDGFRWRIPLDMITTHYDQICAAPEMSRPFEGPVLFLKGTQSDYIPETALPVIWHWFPRAEVVEMAGSGHWMNAEKPDEVLTEIRSFLEV